MPGIDIKKLRQEGKLDDALKMAQEEFEAAPTNDWTKRNLAWVHESYCKKYAEDGNYQDFINSIRALINLGVNETEPMLINAIGWRFRSMLSNLENCIDGNDERIRVLNEMFELVRKFHFEKPSETYSVLFKAFLKYKDIWPEFKEFCEWWDFDRFRPKDYVCEEFASGKKESCCLVERAYIAYSKCLLKDSTKDSEKIKAFVNKLESLAKEHPEMDYPGYFAGKLMIALNENGNDIVAIIRPFIQKRKNEFWAWQLLAESVKENDRDLYLASLLRAIHCGTKDDFLVKIRLMLIEEFVSRQAFCHATQQLTLYCQTKRAQKSNWLPTGEVRVYLEKPWYEQYRSAQSEPFPIDYMALTNNVLFGDTPEQACVVSFINTDKHIANVVYGKKKEGFFKYDSSLCPKIGMKLSIRIQEISKNGYIKVLSARISSESDEELDYYKEVEGTVIYNKNKDIYSFKSGDIICFIPPYYVSQQSLVKDQSIKAFILYTYNKKKEKYMWKITSIKNMV